MNCPVCKVELVLAERSGVEIDYCTQCRGVWLDRGELDKLIERVGTHHASMPRRLDDDEDRFDDRRREDDDGRRRRRENPLSDMFDFF